MWTAWYLRAWRTSYYFTHQTTIFSFKYGWYEHIIASSPHLFLSLLFEFEFHIPVWPSRFQKLLANPQLPERTIDITLTNFLRLTAWEFPKIANTVHKQSVQLITKVMKPPQSPMQKPQRINLQNSQLLGGNTQEYLKVMFYLDSSTRTQLLKMTSCLGLRRFLSFWSLKHPDSLLWIRVVQLHDLISFLASLSRLLLDSL